MRKKTSLTVRAASAAAAAVVAASAVFPAVAPFDSMTAHAGQQQP